MTLSRRFCRLIGLLSFLILCAAPAFAAPGTYLVLPFKVNGPDGFAYLEKAIPSMLASRLYWKDHAQLVEDAAIEKAQRLGNPSSPADLEKFRAAADADYAVWGQVVIAGDNASIDTFVRDRQGKQWHKVTQTPINGLITSMQGVADSINADLFGRPVMGTAGRSGTATMVNRMNPEFMHNETTQRQVYLNPQFRYQGNDGTRLRSQTLPFITVGMEVADVNGDGRNEIVLLSEKRLYVYQWSSKGLTLLGEHRLPTDLTGLLVRTIDLNRDNAAEIVVTTYDPNNSEPRAFIFGFRGKSFVVLAERQPWFLNVTRLSPDFVPALVGQKGDPSRIFAKGGVQEMLLQGGAVSPIKPLNLPKNANALNFTWLPGKAGEEEEKLVVLTADEKLQVYSPKGASLYQTEEKFSGASVGVEEATNLPGLGKSDVLLPSTYFVPLRMLPTDLERDGIWELLVNKPISVAALFFENYRTFPESEIQSLFWDGVGLNLMWKTRRIKGAVADFALSDPNNDSVPDLVVALNTHPGAIGMQQRKTVVVAYPLDLSQTDPKTAPALE